MFSAVNDAKGSARRAPARARIYCIRETVFLYYNNLVSTLCRKREVQRQGPNALGFFNTPEALAKLRDVARNAPDKDLRVSAVMALSRLNDTPALSDNFAVETDTGVKLGIIDALGRVDGG